MAVSFFPILEYSLILNYWDPVSGNVISFLLALIFDFGILIPVIVALYSMIKTKKEEYKRALRITVIAIILYVFNFLWVGTTMLYLRWGDFSYLVIISVVILIIDLFLLTIANLKFSDTQTNQHIKMLNLKSPKRFIFLIIVTEFIIIIWFILAGLVRLNQIFYYLNRESGLYNHAIITVIIWEVLYFIVLIISSLSIIFLLKLKYIGLKLCVISFILSTIPDLELFGLFLRNIIFGNSWYRLYLIYSFSYLIPVLFLIFISVKIYKNKSVLKDYLQSKKNYRVDKKFYFD